MRPCRLTQRLGCDMQPLDLTVDDLTNLATDVRNWMYLDGAGLLDPEKEVGGADTVEAIDVILGRYGLRPTKRDEDRIGGILVFSPIKDCEHQDPDDRCCHHPANLTPECHNFACPLLRNR